MVGRIKSCKNFRNRSRKSPRWGNSLRKSGNFCNFGAAFLRPCGDRGEIIHSQADPRARRPCQVWRKSVQRVAPAGQKNPDFCPVSKFNTGSLPLCGILLVITNMDCCRVQWCDLLHCGNVILLKPKITPETLMQIWRLKEIIGDGSVCVGFDDPEWPLSWISRSR